MKRVLLTVHKFFPEHGAGTEVLTLKVSQELQRRGVEVLVVTADPPDTDARHAVGPDTVEFVHEGVPVKVLREPLRLRGYRFENEYLHPGMAAEFARILDAFRPDIVHMFHAQNLSASIIDCARERNIPVVCSTTDFWFVCPIVQLKLPDGSVCRGPSAGAKNCLSCYTPRLFPPQSEFEEALAGKYPVVKRMLDAVPKAPRTAVYGALFELYKSRKRPDAVAATVNRPAILKDAANKTQAIMVPTLLMRDIFVENGIRSDLIHKVPFGIDTAPLTPFQQKTASECLRIGFIGTLFEHKGVDLLIEAFQMLPENADAELKIYGDLNQFSDYGARLHQLATRPLPNSKKIKFEGTFPNSQLGSVLQNLDVLVVPSRWYENTPLVMQSALATKTPLVVTDLGGMSELVHHEQNGLLFKLNDAKSLRDELTKLLNDRGFLQQLCDNIAVERTVAQMVDDIQSIYVSAGSKGQHAQDGYPGYFVSDCMKALVIGGNGFIGTHLVDALLQAGHAVTVFDRYPSRYREQLPNVKYVSGDFANHGEVDAAVKGVDWVFHLAYTTLPETSNDDPVYDVRSNVIDTLQLLQSCRQEKISKFIFVSSGGTVYGIPSETPIKETHPTEPMCSYGISKLTIEKYLNLYQRLWGLDYVVVRLSNPYGEFQNPFSKQGAIGVFLGNVVQGQPITIWGDGEVVRDYIYIKDAVKALVLAAEYDAGKDEPRIFNIGYGRGHSLNQIVAEIKKVVDCNVEVRYTPSRPVDVPVNVLDISRAQRHLEWQPKVTLADGLKQSWSWIKSLRGVADRLPERTV